MDQTRIAGIRSGMYFRGLMTDEAVENEVHLSTQDGYDRWAAIYDEEDNPLVMLESRFMPPLVGAVDGLSVLDVGCGTGRHSIQLKEAGAKVTAIDFSERMLDRARAKAGAADICFRQHDLGTRFPFATGGFDLVVCALVLDHIADLNLLFAEMKRVVKTGGRVVVSVMHPAILLRKSRARFTDPLSGKVTYPESVPNQLSDYVNAALASGARLEHLSEQRVDGALAAESDRAKRYLGWPMLVLMVLA
ncbi:MAG: ubiquinone/menaquinone biosynthesis C-methylase UbiE [Limisphaerales bacterium]|jgi:ubiquinone/menaquinone biosynthesis C-methylase UbiE